jgi:hypothetical protein
MLKNGKYDSKDLLLFLFHLKKIHHFGGPKHSSILALPGLDRKKNSSSTYCLIAVLIILKIQFDKCKNNEEKAIIVFCNFATIAAKQLLAVCDNCRLI